MKDWQRIREAMDACRPNSQDLHDPELREVADILQNDDEARKMFERSQRLDAKLRTTIREVDVPVGLEQRLLAQLNTSASADPAVDMPLVTAVTEVATRSLDVAQTASWNQRQRHTFSRRRIWMVVVTAVSILVIAGIFFTRPSTLTVERLSALATEWTKQAQLEGDARWKPVTGEQLSPLLRRAHRWKPLDTDLDPKAMILDLSRRGGKRLFVFQFQPKQQVVPLPSVPLKGLQVSGQWHMGAWMEQQGVVYIAVTNDRGLLDSLKSTFRPA
jgi:hypothetical protein